MKQWAEVTDLVVV